MVERILNRKMFLNMLELEVGRGLRYRNFFSILKFKLTSLTGSENESRLEGCRKAMADFLADELRWSDTLGFLGENQWAVIAPYADISAAGLLKLRLMDNLEYFNFEKKGYEIAIDLICFPNHGTNSADLSAKL